MGHHCMQQKKKQVGPTYLESLPPEPLVFTCVSPRTRVTVMYWEDRVIWRDEIQHGYSTQVCPTAVGRLCPVGITASYLS